MVRGIWPSLWYVRSTSCHLYVTLWMQEQAESGFTWPCLSTLTSFFIAGDAVRAYRLFSLQTCCLIRVELKQAIFQQGQFKRLSHPHQLFLPKVDENSIPGRPLTSPPTGMDLGTGGRAKLQKAWLAKQQNLNNEALLQTTRNFNRNNGDIVSSGV